jgi:hypothetical protein
MRRICVVLAGIAISASIGSAQPAATGPYKVLKTAKVGGAGGFDYAFADAAGRRLYVPRTGPTPRVTVFNLDTLEPAGEIPNSSQGDGTLTVIKENISTSFVVEQTVQTRVNAKTLTLDSKTNHILLIAAEYGPPSIPPPAGGRGGRGQMLADSFSILAVGR